MTQRLVNPRRRLILHAAAGAVGTTLAGVSPLIYAGAQPQSTVDVMEGPYFIDERLKRIDLRVDPSDGSIQDGMPLLLFLSVFSLDTDTGIVKPMQGAYVDLWHCNALGEYSDESYNGTVGKKFLRGYQVSDRRGCVRFRTIYPGWYERRSPHIHCKVRQFNGGAESMSLTTQFFFDEQLTQLIYANSNLPYYSHGQADQPQATDMVYSGTNSCAPGAKAGDSLMLELKHMPKYVAARFDLLIDTSMRCSSKPNLPPDAGPGTEPPSVMPTQRRATPPAP